MNGKLSVWLIGLVLAAAGIGWTVTNRTHAFRSLSTQSSAAVASAFHKSLTKSVTKASGSFLLTLHPGQTQTRLAGTPNVTWTVETGTVAKMKFEYDDREWKKLSIDFGDHPVVVRFSHLAPTPSGKQGPFRVRIIDFRRDGTPLDYRDDNLVPQPIPELLYFPELRTHLKMPSEPGPVFSGETFAGLSGQPAALSVREISLPTVSNVEEPVNFTVAAGAEITLSTPPNLASTCAANRIKLARDSDLVFTSLRFNTDGSYAHGTLTPVDFRLSQACLKAGDTILRLGLGSRLQFLTLQFRSPPNPADPVIEGTEGDLSGSVLSGSSIILAKTENRVSSLSPADGSTAGLHDVHLAVVNTQEQSVSVGNGTMGLVGATGQFVFDKNDFISFKEARLTLNLAQSAWTPAAPPNIRGNIVDYEAAITGGEFNINPESRLLIASGRMSAANLNLNSLLPTPISGDFNKVTLNLSPNSTLGVPNKFHSIASNGATLAATPTQRLSFRHGQQGPFGNIEFHIPIEAGNITLGKVGEVELLGGSIDASLVIQPNQPIGGTLAVRVRLGRGTFYLNDKSVLKMSNGAMKADALSLGGPNGVSGVFAEVDFTFDKSVVDVSDAFNVTTKNGGRFIAKFAQSPLTITPDGNYKGEIDLRLPIESGWVKLGKKGELTLSDGYINLDLDKQSGQPLVGSLTTFLSVTSGTLVLNDETTLNISGGTLHAKELKLTSGQGIVGPFVSIDLNIAPSDISIPRSIRFSASGNVHLLANDPTAPLTISADGQMLTGALLLTSEFKALNLSPQSTKVSVTDGSIRLPLRLNVDGSVSGTDISISGRLGLTVSDDSGPTGATHIQVGFTRSTLLINESGSTLRGKFNGQIASVDMRYRVPASDLAETTTEDIKVKNPRMSPLDLYAKLRNPITFREADFVANNNGLSFATSADLAMIIGTASDQQAFAATMQLGGGKWGLMTSFRQQCEWKCEEPAWWQIWGEKRCWNSCMTIEVKIPRPDCDFKLIMKRSEYTLKGKVTLTLDKNIPQLRASELSKEGDLQTDTEGCREQSVFDIFESLTNIAGGIMVGDFKWGTVILTFDPESGTLTADVSPQLKQLVRGLGIAVALPTIVNKFMERMVGKKLGEIQLVFPRYLSITNRGTPESLAVGGEIAYTIDVTNGGPSGYTEVVVTNALSGPATVIEATPSQGTCSQAGTQIKCTIGEIARGGLVSIKVRVRPTAAGIFSNTAEVSGKEEDSIPLDNKSTAGSLVQ